MVEPTLVINPDPELAVTRDNAALRELAWACAQESDRQTVVASLLSIKNHHKGTKCHNLFSFINSRPQWILNAQT